MRTEGFFKDPKVRSILTESWAVSWPMTVIMFFVFIIGLNDVYVAGRFGKEVQAAYGVAFQVFFVLGIVGSALSVGVSSVASRLFTAENKKDFVEAVDSSLVVAAATGFVLSIAGSLCAGSLVGLLHVPEALRVLTISLVRIYAVGLFFHYLLMNTNALLRSSAMIQRSMASMFVVCVLNVFLIFGLALHTPLGVLGIAWATVISTAAGSVLNFWFVRRFLAAGFSFSRSMIERLVRISWPAGLLQLFWQLGLMVLFVIIASFPRHNVEVMAAFTNGLKIEAVIFLPAFAFNMANAVVVGNLIGKGELEDAFRAGIITAVVGTLAVSVITLVVMVNARSIAATLSDNALVIQECCRYIYISLAFEPVMAWGVILGGGLNGAGDTRSVMKVVASSVWLVRLPLGCLLGIYFAWGAAGVWWAMNASIAVQAAFMSRHYLQRKWLAFKVT